MRATIPANTSHTTGSITIPIPQQQPLPSRHAHLTRPPGWSGRVCLLFAIPPEALGVRAIKGCPKSQPLQRSHWEEGTVENILRIRRSRFYQILKVCCSFCLQSAMWFFACWMWFLSCWIWFGCGCNFSLFTTGLSIVGYWTPTVQNKVSLSLHRRLLSVK